jgi:hypothetical protein
MGVLGTNEWACGCRIGNWSYLEFTYCLHTAREFIHSNRWRENRTFQDFVDDPEGGEEF